MLARIIAAAVVLRWTLSLLESCAGVETGGARLVFKRSRFTWDDHLLAIAPEFGLTV